MTMHAFSPRIGLFWFVPSPRGAMLLGVSHPFERVDTLGGFKTAKEAHVDVWENLKRGHPSIRDYAYEHFPRGRVNWSQDDDTFLLLADKQVFERGLERGLITRWHLPADKVKTMLDPHYRTQSLPSSMANDAV
jgi:hypothetical protein